MNQLTKAQISVGLLAFFATLWSLIKNYNFDSGIIDIIVQIVVLFVVLIILSIVLLGILEWVKIFDLKTNSILTLIVLITIVISTYILYFR